MARQVNKRRRLAGLIMAAVMITGCGAAAQLDHWSAREVPRSSESELDPSQGTAKENRHDHGDSERGSSYVPGLAFRFGMSYLDSNESVSTALSVAMHTMLLQRMAVELGVMMSFPTAAARQTDTAVIGGTVSWLWFLGGSDVFRPYFVLGNGVSAGRSGGNDSFGAVLINFIGGLGFDVWLTSTLGLGIDCRAFSALAAQSPEDSHNGVICTAAFAFSP